MEKNSEAVETLQAICEGISENRAKELLDASNGSLERAIDIFFHQKADQEQTVVQPNKKKRSPTTDNREGKQARLDSSFSTEIRIESCAAEGSVNAKEKIEVIAIDDSAGDDDNSQIEAKLLNESAEKEVKESIVAGFKSTRKPLMDTTEHRRTSGSDKKSAHHFVSKISFSRTETLKPQLTFQRLSEALQQMADTTKRLVKLDVLQKVITEIISNADKPERAIVLTYALRLVLGLRTSTDQAPLDVSGSAVSKALQTILGVSRTQLSKGYRQYGDLGDSAASYFQKKTFFVTSVRPLSILELYQSLQKIVQTDGRDSKQHILLQLMRSCQTKTELRFLVRLLIGNMRVGANLKTVLAALAAAVRIDHGKDLDIKGAVELVKKTHDICPNLEKIISALLAGGFEQMKKDCCIQLLTPIAPMLAHPIHSLKDVEEVMNVKKNSTVMEYKYDGVRCQAHYDGTRVNLFSRHLLETTSQYPDAAKSFLGAVKEDKNVESFIIDSEIVGVEGEGDQTRLLPFQDLSRRKRKTDDGLGVRVKVFAFDLMYLNGISFVGRPLWERQQIFHEYFKETESYAFVSSRVLPSYDGNKIKEFLEEAVRCGAEGLMVKMLGMSHGEGEKIHETGSLPPAISTTESSPYEAGTRSHNWLKVKRDYVTGYADTIDVVPIGAW